MLCHCWSSLINLLAQGDIIVISYIGMKSAEVKVPANGQIRVMLKEDSQLMDEMPFGIGMGAIDGVVPPHNKYYFVSICPSDSSLVDADFSVYGIVDTGIIVEHNKMGSQPSSTSAREEFGVNLGPRIGLTGTEDLGNGTKVKMLLENLFESDDGEMLFSRLWGGEASLALEGSMGEIAFGRMGALVSPFGHWGIFGMQATPFGFGWGRSGGMHWMVGGDRLDNTISYATPTIAGGLQLFAQYSFQTGTNADPGVEESKERHNTRRASAAFRWQGQSLTAVGVFDRIMNTHKDGADYGEDTTIASLTVNFLVHPDVRLFVVGQGFKNVYSAPGTPEHPVSKLISAGNLASDNQSGIAGRGFDGWVASLNAQIKCFGGDLYLTSAYDDWEHPACRIPDRDG